MDRRAYMCFLNITWGIQQAFCWSFSYRFSAVKALWRNRLRSCWICKRRLRKRTGLPKLCGPFFPKCKKKPELRLLKLERLSGECHPPNLPRGFGNPGPSLRDRWSEPWMYKFAYLRALSYLNGVPWRAIRMIEARNLPSSRSASTSRHAQKPLPSGIFCQSATIGPTVQRR